MASVKEIISLFGGQTALASAIGKRQSTVAYWVKTGAIPAKWQSVLLNLAKQRDIALTAQDLIDLSNPAGATEKSNGNKNLVVLMPTQGASGQQRSLDLGIQKQIEIDGIGMGVLSDGTPFLTGRGLARLCGVSHRQIQEISTEWDDAVPLPRVTKIREILKSHGESYEFPHIEIAQRSGVFYAYPDAVCLAVLEYYSFDAGLHIKEEAKKNYRLLAGKALRDFIYTQVGYDPSNAVPDEWRQFHDRVSLTYNSVPQGYFGIFKEISDMVVTLGQSGLHIDSGFVPDISVGQAWASHWKKLSLDLIYGQRVKYEHNYPDYFKQALSNPQDANCYPEAALGEFRRWFREVYIGEGKFKNYIEDKVKQRQLPPSFAQLAIAAYVRD